MTTKTVQLRLQLVGDAAAQLKQINNEQIVSAQRLKPVTAEQLNQSKKITNELKQQVTGYQQQNQQLLANETTRQLGLRTEKAINNEIRQAHINYQKLGILQRQGVVSANDMQRAYAAMNTKVSGLQHELGRVEKASLNTSNHAISTAGTWKDAAKSLAAMYGTMQAMNALRSTVTTNLDFERDVLEMKQNAGMTPAQANEIRKVAIDSSNYTLQTPQDVFKASKSFARAGDKFEDIKGNTIEAARAATVYRATPEQVANMDFDLRTKMGIKNSDIPAINNMLYYHGNSGRFEMSSFAQYAPEMLSAATNVGINGIEGANFVGAVAQVLMNKASINEPGKVKTMLEQGAGHITAPHYVKGLKKFGINVEEYMPNGQFYGEGGFPGIRDLTLAMRKKGLTNPFKLAKAGFADQETAKFWLSMMQYIDDIEKEMGKGRETAEQDQIGIDLNEMQQSNFGKVKQTEIAVEKAKLSDAGQKITDAAGTGSQFLTEHPVAAIAGAGAAGVYGYKTYASVKANGILNSSKVLGRAGGIATIGLGAYDAYSAYKNPNLSPIQKKGEYTKAGVTTASTLAGGYVGAQTGAMIGGGIGAVFGGIGAVPGAAIGGLIGGAAGSIGGWWLGDKAGEQLSLSMADQTQQIVESSDNQVKAIEDMKNTLSYKIDTLINATNQNRPVFNLSGGSLLDAVSGATQKESNRHGSVPASPLPGLGG